MADKFTIRDFYKRFKTDEDCLEEIKRNRYPDGITCVKCDKVTNHYKVKGRTSYACAFCGNHIYPLSGTIFEKTSTPLKLWFYAMYLMVQTRAGISAKQLERELGVTYKTAWRMAKQIRMLMADDKSIIDGDVEIDETYIGGKGTNRRWKLSNPDDKAIVMGMVSRNGKAYLKQIPTTGKWALLKQIKEHVDPNARVYTDENPGYYQLRSNGYDHSFINHKETYVKKEIHTQNIENVWSHLKRGIYGVYRVVSKKYLQAYADEYAFRYNNRNLGSGMFNLLLTQVSQVMALEV